MGFATIIVMKADVCISSKSCQSVWTSQEKIITKEQGDLDLDINGPTALGLSRRLMNDDISSSTSSPIWFGIQTSNLI